MSPRASVAVSVMPTLAGSPSSTHSCSGVYSRSFGKVLTAGSSVDRVKSSRVRCPGRAGREASRTTVEGKCHYAHLFGATSDVDREKRAGSADLRRHVRHRDRMPQGGRRSARGDGPDVRTGRAHQHRVAGPRGPPGQTLEADQEPRRLRTGARPQRRLADEVARLVERDHPAEAGVVRRRSAVELLAVERHAGLEAQAVASRETRWNQPVRLARGAK